MLNQYFSQHAVHALLPDGQRQSEDGLQLASVEARVAVQRNDFAQRGQATLQLPADLAVLSRRGIFMCDPLEVGQSAML